MTREGHLQFCKRCVNRALDPQQGLICSRTQKIADFENECTHFLKDESVEDAEIHSHLTNTEIINTLSENVMSRLKAHQNLGYAVAGGALAAMMGALLWAVVTVSTEYQIGYMAVGVGLLIGVAVRLFGAGVDQVFGWVGAFFALLGCLLGNLFTQVGFVAQAQSLGYFETLTFLNVDLVVILLRESFSPIDLLFYAIAVYEGYKFAFRPVTPELVQNLKNSENYDPVLSYQQIRLPLVMVSLVILGYTTYQIKQGANGPTTYYYESGAKMSSGELLKSQLEGEWTYWYENGKKQASAFYKSGIEAGSWRWYDEEENLIKSGEYQSGLPHGVWMNYYANGQPSDSGVYVEGRMHGPWIYRYENGQVSQRANYKRDRIEGVLTYYFENGNINSQGNLVNGELSGLWENWYENGNKKEELEYENGEISLIKNVWKADGQPTVKNGSGVYTTYFESGELSQFGEVENGKREGTWITYYPNGSKQEEGKYEENQYLMMNSWSPKGDAQVVNGKGTHLSYYDDNQIMEQGEVVNGLREGTWELFYESNGEPMQHAEYQQGKVNGLHQAYFENGQLYAEGQMKENKSEGTWTWYYENGTVQTTANFISDKKYGVQTFWNESGLAVKEEKYEAGELISETVLNPE